jgi:hypothetical protein
MMARASFPQVYRAISRITAEFARFGIPKDHTNIQEQYQYRSIDDVTARLAPLLAKYGLCALPRVLRRESEQCFSGEGYLLNHVRLLVAYDLVSAKDASRHSMLVWSEAMDSGDKGTAKALSSAYKVAMLQLFCVPVAGEDADAATYRLKSTGPEVEPPQGWDTWSADIGDLITSCETPDALDRLRSRQSRLLTALKRERPDLYSRVGKGFTGRVSALQPSSNQASGEPAETCDV